MLVYQIKLINGDEILATFIEDLKKQKTMVYEYPMVILHLDKNQNQGPSIILEKYVPFAEDQFLMLHYDKIVFQKLINNEFRKYYFNNINYQELYIEPNTLNNMKLSNDALSRAVSYDTIEFINKARKLNVDLSDLNSGPKH